MYRIRSSALLLPTAVLVVLALSACGGGSSSQSSSTTGSSTPTVGKEEGTSGSGEVAEAEKIAAEAEVAPTTIATAELDPFEPKPGATVSYIVCDQAIEGCARAKSGVFAAAKALGYQVEACYEHLSNPQSGEQCFAQAVAAKPDAIIVGGVGMAAAAKGYAAAEAAGIPIIAEITADPPAPGRTEIAPAESCEEAGEKLGNFVVANSKGKADVLVAYVTAFNCVAKKWEGFEAVLSKCSGCTTKPLQFSPAAIQTQYPQQVQAELQGDPEIDYLAGMYSEPALVGLQQIKQLGDEVNVVGFDQSAPNLEALRKEKLYVGDLGTANEEAGWIAVDAAARVIAGEELPETLPISSVLLTKKNIGEYPDHFEGVAGYQKQFEQEWGG